MKIKHRCFRKRRYKKEWVNSLEYYDIPVTEYHIQRKTSWWPFWYTTVKFTDLETALGALERARKNGHSEVFELEETNV